MVGIHFVSPWYDPSRLPGHETSSIYLYITLQICLGVAIHSLTHHKSSKSQFTDCPGHVIYAIQLQISHSNSLATIWLLLILLIPLENAVPGNGTQYPWHGNNACHWTCVRCCVLFPQMTHGGISERRIYAKRTGNHEDVNVAYSH